MRVVADLGRAGVCAELPHGPGRRSRAAPRSPCGSSAPCTGSCSTGGRRSSPRSTRRSGGAATGDPGPAFLRTVRAPPRRGGPPHRGRRADQRGGPLGGARRRATPSVAPPHGAPAARARGRRQRRASTCGGTTSRYDTGRVVAGDPDSPVRFERRVGGRRRPTCPATLRGRRARRVRPQPARRHHRRGPAHAHVLRVARPGSSASPGSTPPSRSPAGCRPMVDRADAADWVRPRSSPMPPRAWPPSSSTRSCSSTCRRRRGQRFRDAVDVGRGAATERGAARLAADGARRRPGRAAAHHLAGRRGAAAGHRRLPRPPVWWDRRLSRWSRGVAATAARVA